MKTVVISPHPDDETLGCGGTLLKHKKNNDELYWIIMTTVTEDINYPDNYENIRNREIEKVANLYGMKDIFKLNFPAAKLDNIPLKNIIGKISRAFKSIKPEQIYLPNRSDIHSDHRVTFDASFSCTKSFRYSTIKKVLMYETLSETEFAPPLINNVFQPNCYSNISDYINDKIDIMKIYKSEISEHPFPRSEKNVKALATYRGAVAGMNYAESFMILKEIF